MYIFFNKSDDYSNTPFLLDAEMHPLSAVNLWLRHLVSDGATSSFNTIRTYAYHLYDYFSYLEANHLKWDKINNNHFLKYRNTQDVNLSLHTRSHLNRKTINARLNTVGRFYKFATENRFIDANPILFKKIRYRIPHDANMLSHLGNLQIHEVSTATFERLGRARIKWRTHKEVTKWINSICDWQHKLIATLLYRTGMRRAELGNLQIWQLPNKPSNTSNEVSFEIIGKGKKKRTVHLSLRDFGNLQDFINIQRARIMKRNKSSHDYVFINSRGDHISINYINKFFSKISKKCEIHITPHMLRHSFAVFALNHWKKIGLSHPDKLLQARLGHSSVVTTQIYMHLTDEERAMEDLGNASLIEEMIQDDEDEQKQI